MSELNELLQLKLAGLERGEPVEQALDGLAPDAEELAALITLAAAVRALPQPLPSPVIREKVIRAAGEITPLLRRVTSPARPRMTWNLPRISYAIGFAAALLLIALGSFAIWRAAPLGAQTATVMDISGQAEIYSETEGWRALQNGEKLRAGQRLRTLDGSEATLVFYEGSRTTLRSNTDVLLTSVDGSWGKTVRVVIDQTAGQTAHSVVPFEGKQSLFIINTPSGTASVHGTRFNVNIARQGSTRFAVSNGKVLVYNDQGQVFVNAGQATRAYLDDGLNDPAYQFSLRGELQSVSGSQWTVEGVAFTVDANTDITAGLAIGSLVTVEGRILADDTRLVADELSAAQEGQPLNSITGIVEAAGDTWRIGGYDFLAGADTPAAESVKIGSVVQVTFNVLLDGNWQATAIVPLEASRPSLPSVDAGDLSTLIFQPAEVETTGCGSSFTLAGALLNTGSQPASAALDSAVLRGAGYIQSVVITPASFAGLQPGETGAFTIQVNTSAAYQNAAGSQKQIKLRIFETSPGSASNHLTATIVSNCKEKTPTATSADQTPTLTATPTITPTGPTPTATPAETETTCTGKLEHPTGLKLAARYNVSYEEIMGWFCQHYGFGEIDLAYTLSRQSGKPVAEIFALRKTGEGWGNIKKQYEPTRAPNPHKPDAKPTKKPKKN